VEIETRVTRITRLKKGHVFAEGRLMDAHQRAVERAGSDGNRAEGCRRLRSAHLFDGGRDRRR
jgi:hypothetical protein